MQSAQYPFQDKIQTCVRELFVILLPDQEFKSFHDLFNAQKFHRLFVALVNGMNEQYRHKLPDLKLKEDSQSQSYNDMKRKQFRAIAEQIQHVEEILGIGSKWSITEKDISDMVERSSVKTLHKFLEHIFLMFQFNQSLVHEITSMDQDMQQMFFDVMQPYSNMGEGFEDSDNEISALKISSKINRNDLDEDQLAHLEEIENELQSHIQMKDEEIKELKFNKEQLEEEMEEMRQQLTAKNDQLQMLKKRMMAYEQIDQLMIEKDQQIAKLTKNFTQKELKLRVKQCQLTNENKHLHQKVSRLECKELQIQAKYEKQNKQIELLTQQKQQLQTSLRKVITNLKEKIKEIQNRMALLNKQLLQVKVQKQVTTNELQQLKQSIKQPSKPTTTTIFEIPPILNSPSKEDPSEQPSQQQLSVRGHYQKLAQQLSLELARAEFQDEFGHLPKDKNKRFTELLQENCILKQQLHKIQSSSSLDQKQIKDLQDEVQKMKKKINILKRRNDEIENQRKQEIDVMVGIMELYAGSLIESQSGKK